MVRIVILMAAIVPPLVVLGYGIAKGRGAWGSEATWSAFLVGAVAAIVAVAGEALLGWLIPEQRMSPVLGAATSAVVLAAIPEEAIKLFVLVTIAERHVDVRRRQDLLVLAVAVSLGFATFENFFYVISGDDWMSTASLRAITAVPGHGIDGLAMGALLIVARIDRADRAFPLRWALLVPTALHAAYDFPLFAIHKHIAVPWFVTGWLVVIVLSSWLAIRLCNRALARAAEIDRATGRDVDPVDFAEWLLFGGIAAVAAGPLLGTAAVYANRGDVAAMAAALGVFPVALGIDAIRTGIRRRNARRRHRPEFPLAPAP